MEPALSNLPPVSQLAPYIPGLTTPAVGFSDGVYQQLLEGHGSAGLICILRAYAGQLEGDFIELFCTDLLVPVDFHTVTEQEAREEKPIPLHICASRLPDGTVRFRVFGGVLARPRCELNKKPRILRSGAFY